MKFRGIKTLTYRQQLAEYKALLEFRDKLTDSKILEEVTERLKMYEKIYPLISLQCKK